MIDRGRVWVIALICTVSALLGFPPSGGLASAPSLQTCSNIVLDGGFEVGGYWVLGAGPLAPQRASSPVHSGSAAMQLGNRGQPNQAANSWIFQRITIPGDALSADLTFWVSLTSGANAGADVQEALAMVPGATNLNNPLQTLWSTQSNQSSWQKIPASLLSQKGRTIDLYFNVSNDGAGGSTAMVLDDVELTVCRPAAPTPAPSATPVVVTSVFNQIPSGANPQTGPAGATFPVSVEVFAAGVTDQPQPSPDITCNINFALVPSFGAPWGAINSQRMFFDGVASASSHRYLGFLSGLQPGLYEFLASCAGSGNSEPVQVDLAANGGPGRLTVEGGAPPPTLPATPSVTPWPTPAGTPAPVPSDCVELIANGGFEARDAWIFGWNPFPPIYNSDPAFVLSGGSSMALGPISQTSVNVPSYSSIRQDVTLPSSADITLTFSYWPISSAAPNGLNRQELILLDPLAFDETVKVLWRTTENGQTWLQPPAPYSLNEYRGRTLSIYFNARNAGDGTRTAMYLDNVSLQACSGAAAPLAAAQVADTSAVAPPIIAVQQPVLTPVASATVLTVASVPPTTTTVTPSPVSDDQPRSQRPSILDRLNFHLDTPAAVIGAGLAAFLIVLGVVWFFRRRSKKAEPSVSPQPQADSQETDSSSGAA